MTSDYTSTEPIVTKLRELIAQAGGQVPDSLGTIYRAESGKVELHFDCETLDSIRTPEGQYVYVTDHRQPDHGQLMQLVSQTFKIEVLRPRVDDESAPNFQTECSGPVVALLSLLPTVKEVMLTRLQAQGLSAGDAADTLATCIAAEDDVELWSRVTEDESVLNTVWEAVQREADWRGAVPIKYHRDVLANLRTLIFLAGARESGTPGPKGWSLDKRTRSTSGRLEIVFDYGIPELLITPLGAYHITNRVSQPDADLLWKFLNELFITEEIRPKRNDAETRAENYLSYELAYSGPLVTIVLREECAIIDKLAEVLEKTGGRLPSFGAMYPSESGKVELGLEGDEIMYIRTREGQYVYSGNPQPDVEQFMQLLNETFKVEVVRERLDPHTSEGLTSNCLGPILGISIPTANNSNARELRPDQQKGFDALRSAEGTVELPPNAGKTLDPAAYVHLVRRNPKSYRSAPVLCTGKPDRGYWLIEIVADEADVERVRAAMERQETKRQMCPACLAAFTAGGIEMIPIIHFTEHPKNPRS